MSSLWTPGGEVPVDRNRSADTTSSPPPSEGTTSAPPPGSSGGATDAEEARRQQAAAIQEMLLSAPASEIVAQHVVGMIELAALHLSQDPPGLRDASLAIDGAGAVLDTLGDRLGSAGTELRNGLAQLKMAYVQVAQRSGSGAADAPDDATS